MNMTIFKRNTNVEMARSGDCQNLIDCGTSPRLARSTVESATWGTAIRSVCANQIRRNISPDTPAFLDPLGSANSNVSIDTFSVA